MSEYQLFAGAETAVLPEDRRLPCSPQRIWPHLAEVAREVYNRDKRQV